ncbi:MAG TPA: hypothetical protein PKA00_10735 [Saprospiraceae bacterium]|nr:hypothetical protein [Saprospiraceae bacterium]HMQ83377.1 hypothetical protein [Saprospiraceae bacterium]
MKPFTWAVLCMVASLLYACNQVQKEVAINSKDNAALFNYLYQSILQREALSPIKYQRLGISLEQDMLQLKTDFIQSRSLDELLQSMLQLSNCRKDAHLKVQGLKQAEPSSKLYLPLRFEVDFSDPHQPFLIVSELAANYKAFAGLETLQPGSQLSAINDIPIGAFIEKAKLFVPYSTEAFFYAKLAQKLTWNDPILMPFLENKIVRFTFENKQGGQSNIQLNYVEGRHIRWRNQHPYKAMDLLFTGNNFRCYRPCPGEKILLLEWLDFEADMPSELDAFMEKAAAEAWLDSHIILDASNSSGGENAGYLLRHLSDKSFKVTFGNLKISPITEAFVDKEREFYKKSTQRAAKTNPFEDDGKRLLDWLSTEVRSAIRQGRDYSNSAPFKLRYPTQDGYLSPAPRHFTGKLVAFFGPKTGSQVDQLAAMVIDNHMGYSVGMPTGGFSNTWQWEEAITYPGTNNEIATFSWSIGQTIRPNGEVLEGNPPMVKEWIPMTRDNYQIYHELLLQAAYQYLGVGEGACIAGGLLADF